MEFKIVIYSKKAGSLSYLAHYVPKVVRIGRVVDLKYHHPHSNLKWVYAAKRDYSDNIYIHRAAPVIVCMVFEIQVHKFKNLEYAVFIVMLNFKHILFTFLFTKLFLSIYSHCEDPTHLAVQFHIP